MGTIPNAASVRSRLVAADATSKGGRFRGRPVYRIAAGDYFVISRDVRLETTVRYFAEFVIHSVTC